MNAEALTSEINLFAIFFFILVNFIIKCFIDQNKRSVKIICQKSIYTWT